MKEGDGWGSRGKWEGVSWREIGGRVEQKIWAKKEGEGKEKEEDSGERKKRERHQI
jgi:hypothetical protein